MNKRRKLVIALGAGAFIAPFTSFAQQPGKIWRIGYLANTKSSDSALLDAFRGGMRALGYAEGRDYVIEIRVAQNDLTRLPALAGELVAQKVDLILGAGTMTVLAAAKAAPGIPIVTTTAGDPVGNGYAASLARPGGFVTGLTNLSSELNIKKLDLLRQLRPGIQRVGLLYNATDKNDLVAAKRLEERCASLHLRLVLASADKSDALVAAFKNLVRQNAQGLIVTNNTVVIGAVESTIKLAAAHRLPAVFGSTRFTSAGGLLTYGADSADLYRRAAAYVHKIIKGAKPGNLPIEQPTTFDFVINMKTAKALGIKIPNSILVQATRVIE